MKEYGLKELQTMLSEGLLTSRELVRMYVQRIEQIDQAGPCLNSVSELNPDAMRIADLCDRERALGHVRGPLHGIPVLLKDNINTAGKMRTTASSFALADLHAKTDAYIVKRLRKAGAIILGKTNLSEFAYFMSTNKMPSGYGSLNGQVKHPYNDQIDPLGSSTGSAVAVAANLCPVAVGTETNGSLTAPAKQNLIVTIKPTMGLVSRTGIIPIAHTQDTAGPLARSVEDAAILLEAMAGTDPADFVTKQATRKKEAYSNACGQSIVGMRIGVISFSNEPDDETEKAILNEAIQVLKKQGAILEPLTIKMPPLRNYPTLLYEFKADLNKYLLTVDGCTQMRSLADIIRFNKNHPQRCLKHGQNILTSSQRTKGDLSEPRYHELRTVLMEEANQLTRLMKEHHWDCVISAKRTSYAPIAGNPCIVVPARPLTDLVPRSLNFIGKHFDEFNLIKVTYAYEQATHHRHRPVFMID